MICFIASPISQISSFFSQIFKVCYYFSASFFPFHLQLDSVVPSRELITVVDLKHSRIASLFSKISIEYPLFVLRFTNCSAFRISTDLNSLILFGFPLSLYIYFVSWYRADSSQSRYCLFLRYRADQP